MILCQWYYVNYYMSMALCQLFFIYLYGGIFSYIVITNRQKLSKIYLNYEFNSINNNNFLLYQTYKIYLT